MVFMIFFFTIVLGFTVLALVRMYGGWNDKGNDGPNGDEGPPWRRGGRGPRGPRPRPRSPEPSWWPEFEREFRLYAKSQRLPSREVSGVR